MPSIIEGYTYDIFISYRQKDNKGDRWVSEFVEALKTELESTFKEEISVYFDINPHDGLLETHDLDPLSADINLFLGRALYSAGQYDTAIEEIQKTLAINTNYFPAHYAIGLAYYSKQMYKEAVEEWDKAVDLSDGNPFLTAWLISGYYIIGEKDQADKLFNGLKKRSETEYVPATSFYLIHRIRGEEEMALDWLKKACDEHDTMLPWFKISIPEGSRDMALLKEVGLL